jgi:hypothetical protein
MLPLPMAVMPTELVVAVIPAAPLPPLGIGLLTAPPFAVIPANPAEPTMAGVALLLALSHPTRASTNRQTDALRAVMHQNVPERPASVFRNHATHG